MKPAAESHPTPDPAKPASDKPAVETPAAFNPDSTQTFQAKMPAAPVWFSSMAAGNSREKSRLRTELAQIKGAVPLLMKQRNGGTWTAEERKQLRQMVRSLTSVSPYLLVWAVPGSLLILPFLAWHLDTRRKRRASRSSRA
ncbi:MAG: hypothetical protein ABJA49_14265 [Betaproteobacteria bacterium]